MNHVIRSRVPTFFYPDYTVGTEFSSVPACGRLILATTTAARGLISYRCMTTDRELA